jgi:hypothetical protein
LLVCGQLLACWQLALALPLLLLLLLLDGQHEMPASISGATVVSSGVVAVALATAAQPVLHPVVCAAVAHCFS